MKHLIMMGLLLSQSGCFASKNPHDSEGAIKSDRSSFSLYGGPSGSNATDVSDNLHTVWLIQNGMPRETKVSILFTQPTDTTPILDATISESFSGAVYPICITIPDGPNGTYTMFMNEDHKEDHNESLLSKIHDQKKVFYLKVLTETSFKAEETLWLKFNYNADNFAKIMQRIGSDNKKKTHKIHPLMGVSVGLASIFLLFCLFKYYK